MKNILFVVASYIPASGAEKALLEYLKVSTTNNFLLMIGTNRDNITLFEEALPQHKIYFWQYEKYSNNALARFVTMPMEAAKAARNFKGSDAEQWINTKHIDYVYFNNTLENALFYNLFPTYRKISHIHDMVKHLRPAWGYCGAKNANKSKIIFTPSEACAMELSSYGVDRSRIAVAYNGVSYNRNAPVNQDYSNGLTISFVGGALKRKGFDFLIQMVNYVDQKKIEYGIPKIKLIIATNTDENQYFKDCIAEISSAIDVHIFRKLNSVELEKQYRETNILFVPSRNDPAPLVVAESTLNGCCVIGSKCDGIPEMVQNKKLLFAIDDINQFAVSLEYWLALTPIQRETMIIHNQEFIVSRFNEVQKVNLIEKYFE